MLTIMIINLMLLLLPALKMKFSWHTSSMSLLLSSFMFMLYYLPSEFFLATPSVKLFSMDSMAAPLIVLTLWVSSLMLLASYSILYKNSKHMFLLLVLVLNFVLLIAFFSSNMLMFYIFFEASLIPTALIILGWGYQPERLQASFYMTLYTVSSSLPLLIMILSIYSAPLSIMFSSTPHLPLMMKSTLYFPLSLMLSMAFFVKMPLYLVHLWLPKAHVEAPVAGSMILAGVLLKLGGYGFMRISSMVQFLCTSMSAILSSVALWGAVITSMICIRQTDLKSLIAYSSVSHMGLMAAGVMSYSTWGWEGALTMMLAHGLSSSALFVMANMMYEATNTRSLFLIKGLLSLFPAMSFWWFIMLAANMAAPPSLNLLSEILLLSSILSISSLMLIPIALSSFLAAAYSLFLYTTTHHGFFPKFSNPMSIYMSRNYFIISMHAIPLYTLILKFDVVSNWLS